MLGYIIYAILGIITLTIGASISYCMARFVVPPFVTDYFEKKYSDEEFIKNTVGKTWDMMGETLGPKIGHSIMVSLKGGAMRDIRTLSDGLDDIDEAISEEILPQIQITPESLAAIQAMAKKPIMARKMEEYLELYQTISPFLQNMKGGNGSGFVPAPPAPPQSGSWL